VLAGVVTIKSKDLLGCNEVRVGDSPTFRRNMSPPKLRALLLNTRRYNPYDRTILPAIAIFATTGWNHNPNIGDFSSVWLAIYVYVVTSLK
jgi:hypothetical protein